MTVVAQYETAFFQYMATEMTQDLAHDLNHVTRVVKTAKWLSQIENGCQEIVVPAAYLHDCFSFSKNHARKSESSTIAADKAIAFLETIEYPAQFFQAIHHAIAAHSFSANICAQTLEAKIVQDADRLDALGAIGIARTFYVGASLDTPMYSPKDPFCGDRQPDDRQFSIDHFYKKILRLEFLIHTESARQEAKIRTQFIRAFLQQLESEIVVNSKFNLPCPA